VAIDAAHLLNCSTDSFDDFLWDASRGEIPDVRLAMEGLVEFHRGPGDTTNCNHPGVRRRWDFFWPKCGF
jgi:hypothetical protein